MMKEYKNQYTLSTLQTKHYGKIPNQINEEDLDDKNFLSHHKIIRILPRIH